MDLLLEEKINLLLKPLDLILVNLQKKLWPKMIYRVLDLIYLIFINLDAMLISYKVIYNIFNYLSDFNSLSFLLAKKMNDVIQNNLLENPNKTRT